MHSKRRSKRKTLILIFLVILALILIFLTWFSFRILISPPRLTDTSADTLVLENKPGGLKSFGDSWIRAEGKGWWIMYLKGSPYARGLAHGKLAKELIYEQEKAFVCQIRKMIPSEFYLKFLKYFIYWFNRDLDHYISTASLQEIYGVSKSASPEFSFIGSNYQRMLNYHSAHDIGHAMEQLSLVGCTSFGTWGSSSEDGDLIIGRNFDFYMGDDFARNRILCIEQPDSGYAFMTITWAGMTGAVSGMNSEGLTVTLNAAKSDIPWSARIPISLLAKEILQYASDIAEAFSIAEKNRTFVSESLLIGSSKDRKAAIIEKSPFKTLLLDPRGNSILCANHFQSAGFAEDPLNRENIRDNASVYRQLRLRHDLDSLSPMNPEKAAWILRDMKGLMGRNIGMGNEKAMNQLIAHHSVIFMPGQKLVWISEGPWQAGAYKCFNLNKIFNTFAASDQAFDFADSLKEIPPDIFLSSKEYQNLVDFRKLRVFLLDCIRKEGRLKGEREFLDRFIQTNPEFYETWYLSAEYFYQLGEFTKALGFYEQALRCEVPRWSEKKKLIGRMVDCRARSQKSKAG